jgi:integrase
LPKGIDDSALEKVLDSIPRDTPVGDRDYAILMLMVARRLGPPGSLRPVVVSTLIGLLCATGIRIGEALDLALADIDLKGLLLHIREGKFNKSRYVPISASTASRLAAYLRLRRKAEISTAATSPVFVGFCGGKCWQSTFATAFLQVLRKIGLRGPKGQHGPRVHDFRHSFAVNRLLAWYRHGDNLAAKLPLLATYLGHTNVTGTQVYLHATAQLLESVGRRFHTHFAIPSKTRKRTHGRN